MECHCHNCKQEKISPWKEYGSIVLSTILLAAGFALRSFRVFDNLPSWSELSWFLIAYLPVAIPVMKEAWECLCRKDVFNEFTLMFIATIGAFYIGEYPEGVAVMLFYSLGELLQGKAVGQAQRSIRALLDVRPETATVVQEDGTRHTISPQQVHLNEVIEVKTGERIPLDGILLEDAASFNTAALTGESVPRTIHKDEEVLAGMITTEQPVHLRVCRPFEQSALSRILDLVQHAASRKAPAELFIRRFARIYTPIVTGLAVLIVLFPWIYSLTNEQFIFLFDEWLYRALIFLVISCPCALVISIPLSYFGGIGVASRQGILFKGGNYLDAITRINTVVFDKTGTLTVGSFCVQHCSPATDVSEETLIRLVASVEQNSTHPIARAIVAEAQTRNIQLTTAHEVKEIAGQGLKAIVDGDTVLIGNTHLLSSNGVACPGNTKADNATSVICAVNGQYIGTLLLADTLKADAHAAIQELKALRIKDIQMLSGDKQSIVTSLAHTLGIKQAYGDLLPEGKVEHIESLRQNPTNHIAFVGDGINDAPVLALSDIGIAMGKVGSDAVIETADIVIQNDQPSKVATAIRIGRYTQHIAWQNIALALGIKLLVLMLGVVGIATLWEAVFADVGVALLAILNTIRIQRKQFDDTTKKPNSHYHQETNH